MGELIGILIIIGITYILCNSTSWKFDNYMPPEGQRIDKNAQALDRVRNNLTNEQVMNNTINGKYNVKRQICKPSENNLVAFLVDEIERMWYNCVDVGWEIRNGAAGLYVYPIQELMILEMGYNEATNERKDI